MPMVKIRRHFNFSEYPFCIGDLNSSRTILEEFQSPRTHDNGFGGWGNGGVTVAMEVKKA